jgi:tetraacyldisaccharide 4'-kinase
LSGLRRADVAIVTRCDLVDASSLNATVGRIQQIAPGLPVATAAHRPARLLEFPADLDAGPGTGRGADPESLAGQQVGLFCSIGNPIAFQRTVERLGAAVVWFRVFGDHHWFTPEDVAEITTAPVERLVTTEKDAAKLGVRPGAPPLWPLGRPLSVLRVELALQSGSAIVEKLFHEALDAAAYVG